MQNANPVATQLELSYDDRVGFILDHELLVYKYLETIHALPPRLFKQIEQCTILIMIRDVGGKFIGRPIPFSDESTLQDILYKTEEYHTRMVRAYAELHGFLPMEVEEEAIRELN